MFLNWQDYSLNGCLWLFLARVVSPAYSLHWKTQVTSHSLKILTKMTSPSSQKSFVYSSADMDWKSRNKHLRNDFWPRSKAWPTVWLQQWIFHGTPDRINNISNNTFWEGGSWHGFVKVGGDRRRTELSFTGRVVHVSHSSALSYPFKSGWHLTRRREKTLCINGV